MKKLDHICLKHNHHTFITMKKYSFGNLMTIKCINFFNKLKSQRTPSFFLRADNNSTLTSSNGSFSASNFIKTTPKNYRQVKLTHKRGEHLDIEYLPNMNIFIFTIWVHSALKNVFRFKVAQQFVVIIEILQWRSTEHL